jgi:hypothetical protein
VVNYAQGQSHKAIAGGFTLILELRHSMAAPDA